jgi:hypothetical protein
MDGLLGLIIALLVFAGIIYLASRTAGRMMLIGLCLAVLAVLVLLGVFRWL